MSDPTNLPPTGEPEPLQPPPTPSSSYQAPSMPDLTDLVDGSKGRKEPTPSSGISRGLLVGGVVGALVIAGGAFFAGRAMASGPATLVDAVAAAQAGTLPCGTPTGNAGGAGFVTRLCATGTGTGGPTGATGQGGQGGFGGRGVFGAVTAVSASSITVNTRAGSVTVAVPSSATVSMTVAGTMTDVKVGDNVTVASTTDASGNRTASSITIVPAGSLPGGFGGGGTAPTAGPA